MIPRTVSPALLRGPVTMLRTLLKSVAREAYLFGSFAAGTAIPGESDVDLLILPKGRLSLPQAYRRLDRPLEAFLSAGLALHIILYDPMRHPANLLATARNGKRLV